MPAFVFGVCSRRRYGRSAAREAIMARMRAITLSEQASTMSKYRKHLPQLSGGLFLTDGGLETTLIFHDGMELPHFAAFHLLRDGAGREALTRYFERYIAIAKSDGCGFILESPTWRASTDWGDKLGYTHDEIAAANRESIRLMLDLRDRHETASTPMVVSGCVGPRGDGYDPGQVMSAGEAEAYHAAADRGVRREPAPTW